MTNVTHVYDGDECVADLDASGNPLRAYTWGPGIDDLLAITVYGGAATNTYYALTDHLGTVHALVDASGDTAAQFTYDAWGNVQSAVGSGQLAMLNRFLFQGREFSWATILSATPQIHKGPGHSTHLPDTSLNIAATNLAL